MKKLNFILSFLLFTVLLSAQSDSTKTSRVTSTVDSSQINELTLIQEFDVNVSIDSVWNTFTTKEGWESAFVAKAEVDFKIGGLILTSYDKDATIGDSSTIVLHVVNYVPKKLITLQAEITRNFPDFMKSDEKDFYNVIYFEELETEKTRITSYGIGYKNTPKYMSMMNFFVQGNEYSYLNLIKYLEEGVKN